MSAPNGRNEGNTPIEPPRRAARVFPAAAELPPELLAGLEGAGWELAAEWDGERLLTTLQTEWDGLLLVYSEGLTERSWEVLPASVVAARAAGWHCAVLLAGDLDFASAERLAGCGLEEVWLAGPTWESLSRRAKALAQERDARAAADRLSQAVEMAACGITIADVTKADQPLIYVNDGFRRMTGFVDAEVIGQNCRLLQGNTRELNIAEVMRDSIRAGKPIRTVLTNFRKDGRMFKNELSLRPLRNPSGRVTHYVGVQIDVTARLDSARQLREAQEQFESVSNAVPVKLWMTRASTGAHRYNEAWAEVFGPAVRENEAPPDWMEYISAEDRAVVDAALARVQAGGRVGFDARLRMAGGGECWHHFAGVMEPDGQAGRMRFVGAAWDISQAQAAREEFSRCIGSLSLRLMVIRQVLQESPLNAGPMFSESVLSLVGELLQCGSLRLERLTGGHPLVLNPAGAWDGEVPAFFAEMPPASDVLDPGLLQSAESTILPVATVMRLGGRSGSEVVMASLIYRGACAGVVLVGAFRPSPAWAQLCQEELRAILPALAVVAAARP